jgi:hypothetical protein
MTIINSSSISAVTYGSSNNSFLITKTGDQFLVDNWVSAYHFAYKMKNEEKYKRSLIQNDNFIVWNSDNCTVLNT